MVGEAEDKCLESCTVKSENLKMGGCCNYDNGQCWFHPAGIKLESLSDDSKAVICKGRFKVFIDT